MDRRPAVVAAVILFQGFNEFLKIKALVNLDKQMFGIYEVSEPLRGKLE